MVIWQRLSPTLVVITAMSPPASSSTSCFSTTTWRWQKCCVDWGCLHYFCIDYEYLATLDQPGVGDMPKMLCFLDSTLPPLHETGSSCVAPQSA